MDKAHRQQHEVGVDLEFAARNRLELGVDAHAMQLLHHARSRPRTCVVITAKSRAAPSSWLDEVRSFSGQFGQVSSLFSCSGGCGMISKLVTDSAPWRNEVPMQSEPVSPPPMTTTCLPVARIGSLFAAGSPADAPVLLRQEIHGEVNALELAAGHRQVARLFGAAGEHHGVIVLEQLVGRDIDADMGAVMNTTPSACICSTRRSM
jgi:hypothetical protein